MNLFKWLFHKKAKPDIPPMPSWEATIEMMYDKDLDAFSSEITRVIYSKDKSMRYVILKNDNGLLTYQLEAIYEFDGETWEYLHLSKSSNKLPAMWEPYKGILEKSFFEREEDLLKELKSEPEYKQYF